MCYYSIDYTITSTFSDDGFVTDAKTTPTLFESLQKMTEDCTKGLLPIPFFKFNVIYLTKNSWQTYVNLLLALSVTGVQTKGSACWSVPSDFSVNLLDIKETKEINH